MRCERCQKIALGKRIDAFFCSDNCRKRAWEEERREYNERCAHCGEKLWGRADQKWCSVRCRVAAHRAAKRKVPIAQRQ